MENTTNTPPEIESPPLAKLPPNPIFKCRMMRRMDEITKLQPAIRQEILEALKDRSKSMIDLGLKYEYVQGEDEETHTREDWLSADSGWFKGHHAEPILREAFIKIGELAIEHDLPVDAYWARGASQFEVAICKSDQQITMIIFAPTDMVEPFGDKLTREDNIWVTRMEETKADGKKVVVEQIMTSD